jgi:hypothetical protein
MTSMTPLSMRPLIIGPLAMAGYLSMMPPASGYNASDAVSLGTAPLQPTGCPVYSAIYAPQPHNPQLKRLATVI